MSTMITGWRIHAFALNALVIAARAKAFGAPVVRDGAMPTLKEIRRRYGVSAGRWMTVVDELDYLAKSVDAGVVWYKHECPFYEALRRDGWVVLNGAFVGNWHIDEWIKDEDLPDCDEDFLVDPDVLAATEPGLMAIVIQAIADTILEDCTLIRIDRM